MNYSSQPHASVRRQLQKNTRIGRGTRLLKSKREARFLFTAPAHSLSYIVTPVVVSPPKNTRVDPVDAAPKNTHHRRDSLWSLAPSTLFRISSYRSHRLSALHRLAPNAAASTTMYRIPSSGILTTSSLSDKSTNSDS